MKTATARQEREFIDFANQRAKEKGLTGLEINRKNLVTAGVSRSCKILSITRDEFYSASMINLEDCYPKIEIAFRSNAVNNQTAEYVFRLRLEQTGSVISPIRNKKASRKRTKSDSNTIAKANRRQIPPEELKVIIQSKGNVEITVSNDDGRLNYSILQLQ
jgi:hypothetical protein